MRIGSLFSGAGGLDMAVEAVFGGTTVWHSEVDRAASRVLEYRYPHTPNLGDITAIDWSTVEPVDVLCGGFPCTDVSAAGKRAGMHGTRSGLWSYYANAIDILRPKVVIIENVRGLLSAHAHRPMESDDSAVGNAGVVPVLRAAGAVLGDLADLLYDAWGVTVSASAVGAPHRRERVFIIATAADMSCSAGGGPQQQDLRAGGREVQQPRECAGECPTCGRHAADTSSNGRDEGRPEPARLERGFDAALGGDGPLDLLPTPTSSDGSGGGIRTGLYWEGTTQSTGDGGNSRLRDVVGLLLPTPRASDPSNSTSHSSEGFRPQLGEVVRTLLPTPCSRDFKDSTASPGVVNRNTPSLGAIDHYLPTPAAADGQRGQDFARAGRDGSGGDDLVTLAVKATRDTQWGKYAPAIQRWENLTRPAPAPTEPNTKGNPRLSAAFSEWMMGWPEGWVTSPAIGISRNDQLRIVGNGVCPQQAIAALRSLLAVEDSMLIGGVVA